MKMTKILLLSYALFFSSGAVNAVDRLIPDALPEVGQMKSVETAVAKPDVNETDALPANWKVRTGIKASFIIDMVGPLFSSEKTPGQDVGYGGALGGAVRFDHKSGWFVETGLSVGYVSSQLQMKERSSGYSAPVWQTRSFRRGRISLPVFAGHGFSLSDMLEMNVNTGFECSYTFAGKVGGQGSEYSMFGTNGVWRRWNLMYTIGLGLELDMFSIEINGGFGLLNLARRDVFHNYNMYENYAAVSLVYWGSETDSTVRAPAGYRYSSCYCYGTERFGR